MTKPLRSGPPYPLATVPTRGVRDMHVAKRGPGMKDEVLVEHIDGVAVITINRPDAKNAINRAVTDGVAAAVDELDERADLIVGILTGTGGTFSAGMDLKAFLAGETVTLPGRGLAGICIRPPSKPILRLPRRIPPAIAMELALTGDTISAADAHRYGLVNSLAQSGGALSEALQLAARIASNGPLAVARTKQILTDAPDWTIAEGFEKQKPIIQSIFASEDAREGALAFAEKRPPAWLGR